MNANDFNIAEMAGYNLRRFVGEKADRDQAAKAFPLWEFYEHLTRETRDAVLSTFPEPVETVANPDFYAEAVAQ